MIIYLQGREGVRNNRLLHSQTNELRILYLKDQQSSKGDTYDSIA